MEGNVKWQCEACIHPYKNLFHNIFGAVEFPDNTVYQFLLFLEEFPVPSKILHEAGEPYFQVAEDDPMTYEPAMGNADP